MNQSPPLSNILGAAVFDPNGLPREYYVTQEHQGTEWVQTVFQALSLKALMTSSLQLKGFQSITIRTGEWDAVVVQLKNSYTALLLKRGQWLIDNTTDPAFDDWVRNFEASILRNSDRFQIA
ncbi:MAG: hypothetical protein AAF215_29935 [Cyanobacteria bacterium P01_A01_bin.123]